MCGGDDGRAVLKETGGLRALLGAAVVVEGGRSVHLENAKKMGKKMEKKKEKKKEKCESAGNIIIRVITADARNGPVLAGRTVQRPPPVVARPVCQPALCYGQLSLHWHVMSQPGNPSCTANKEALHRRRWLQRRLADAERSAMARVVLPM